MPAICATIRCCSLTQATLICKWGQPQEAANILNRYTFNNKDDSNGWDLLAQAEAALNNRDQEPLREQKVMRSPRLGSGYFLVE